MRKKKLFLTLICYLVSTTLFALSVPFQNQTVNANQSVSASYSFGLHKTIFCYVDTTQNVFGLFWTYQGKPYSGVIPLSLTNSALYSGQFADPNGTLTILNQSSGALQFSCLFGF